MYFSRSKGFSGQKSLRNVVLHEMTLLLQNLIKAQHSRSRLCAVKNPSIMFHACHLTLKSKCCIGLVKLVILHLLEILFVPAELDVLIWVGGAASHCRKVVYNSYRNFHRLITLVIGHLDYDRTLVAFPCCTSVDAKWALPPSFQFYPLYCCAIGCLSTRQIIYSDPPASSHQNLPEIYIKAHFERV